MIQMKQTIGLLIIAGFMVMGCESSVTDSTNSANNISSEDATLSAGKKQTVGTNAGALGKVTVGTDVTEWDSGTTTDPANGIYPIGGTGQLNGEFTVAERNGIQIGLRAQERFEGTIEASGNRTGVYEAETGFSSGTRATWNYDWHLDLRGAEGRYADKTLGDYDLTLETDIASSLFENDIPMDLTFGSLDNGVLYQGSWNPDFGNDVFDPTVEGTYHFRLVLTPSTFNGPPLAVAIEINVSDPA